MNAQAQRIAAMHSQKKPKNTQYRQNNSREERQQTQTVQAKKIIGVPNTVQHRSSKAQALMSPQPTRSQASQSEMKQMSENVRHMNTSKFLHTNLDGYLKEGERVGCIDCQNCVRIKDKVLQFKYNPSIKSSYGANFANSSAHKRQAQFNLDNERRQLKVPYKPPGTFTTTNGANLINSKGTGMIGAMTSDGKGYKRMGAPKGETEDGVPRAFVNNSSYQLTYPTYGRLPEANLRPNKGF